MKKYTCKGTNHCKIPGNAAYFSSGTLAAKYNSKADAFFISCDKVHRYYIVVYLMNRTTHSVQVHRSYMRLYLKLHGGKISYFRLKNPGASADLYSSR